MNQINQVKIYRNENNEYVLSYSIGKSSPQLLQLDSVHIESLYQDVFRCMNDGLLKQSKREV